MGVLRIGSYIYCIGTPCLVDVHFYLPRRLHFLLCVLVCWNIKKQWDLQCTKPGGRMWNGEKKKLYKVLVWIWMKKRIHIYSIYEMAGVRISFKSLKGLRMHSCIFLHFCDIFINISVIIHLRLSSYQTPCPSFHNTLVHESNNQEIWHCSVRGETLCYCVMCKFLMKANSDK